MEQRVDNRGNVFEFRARANRAPSPAPEINLQDAEDHGHSLGEEGLVSGVFQMLDGTFTGLDRPEQVRHFFETAAFSTAMEDFGLKRPLETYSLTIQVLIRREVQDRVAF